MAVAINCRGNLLPEKLHLHKSIKVNKKKLFILLFRPFALPLQRISYNT